MKVKFSPQGRTTERVEYQYFEEIIKADIYLLIGEEREKELTETVYIDLSSIEIGVLYRDSTPLLNAKRDENGELHIELLNYIGDNATQEDKFPEWFEAEFEEFDIPEDAEIIQLEELVVPEPEPSPVDSLKAENHELKNRISSLQSSMTKNQKDTEDLIVSLMMMM